MNRRIKAGVLITALIVTVMFVVASVPPISEVGPSVPTGKAQFVLASWSYPDEYGQGIEQIQVEENSTNPGTWEGVDLRKWHENQEYDWNVSVFIRLRVFAWMNNSLVGATDLEDGWNYQRLNVTVTIDNGTTVFSQQNFTTFVKYDTYDPMWSYQYYVILNFLPDYGWIYTATITYEIYW